MHDCSSYQSGEARHIGQVIRLQVRSTGEIDETAISGLIDVNGVDNAEKILVETIDQIITLYDAIRSVHRACDFGKLPDLASEIIPLARQLGLCTVIQVANDICICARANDTMALAAVVARLSRVIQTAQLNLWIDESI